MSGSRDRGPYQGPPYYPPHTCMWCGVALDDPGAGFIEHVKANLDCFVQWQQFRNNMMREGGSS